MLSLSMESPIDTQKGLHYKLRIGSRESFYHSDASSDVGVSWSNGTLTYTGQLEDYISRYKRRPPDIKYWPYGPYWPRHFDGLLLNTPRHLWVSPAQPELLVRGDFARTLLATTRTIDNQVTQFKGKWRGIQVAYDADRSPRDFNPLPVPEGCCPTLMFESRFECGNLRQARRVGQYEYELVLKSDLYTARHTQWYYFRVSNTVPGVTYKFRIVNLLKRDSLYNHGMRPLVYSENDAQEKQIGWIRTGHHISYSRNYTNHNCPLLIRGVTYHMLEWQMEFPNADDTYYLAHCYPYSFTDLKEDLEVLMNSEERSQVTTREVMCETRAGNSCFLLTVTNFESQKEKKAVVITARVHPGESQASWMMKGLLEFITGPDPVAQDLRNKFVFKLVPMINPDGVIVGNYRCSLAARDLNRNYRHPRRDNFPTVWHLKNMVENVGKKYQIALYCDLHGHSRKPNVFMYGNNTSADGDHSPMGVARAFLSERLFPWLMSERSPDKFHFKSCKFRIRRCKESTGRVVMWRQMRVFNSFTLEATFSGTVLDSTNFRHFNILDFMEMGKVLAQTVRDYQKMQDDPTQQTHSVLGLTRVITEQILMSRGLIEPETSLPDFSVHKDAVASDVEKAKASAEEWTGALLTLLNTPREVPQDVEGRANGNKSMGGDIGRGAEPRHVYSREEVMQMLENMAGGQSMDDCLGLLAKLDVQDAIVESDSSDSDSESEPEMKPPEHKNRKKKRKSKKQRDKDNEKKMSKDNDKKDKEDPPRAKSLSKRHSLPDVVSAKALPTLNVTCRPTGSNSVCGYTENSMPGQSKQQATSTSEKYRASRQPSGFISKYEGRHNGGVPCFTEERSMERAAKRMAELRRKHDDDKTKDMTFYCVDESGMHTVTQEDLNQRLHDISDGNPNISATALLGMNVRTGYTHADNLQELSPSPSQPLNGVNSYLLSTFQSQQGHHHHSNDLHDQSTTDGSDNNDENGNGVLYLPMTARRNPYHHLDPIEPRPASDLSVVRHSYTSATAATTLPPATLSPIQATTAASTLSTTSTLPSSFSATSSLASHLNYVPPLTVNPLSNTNSLHSNTGTTSLSGKTQDSASGGKKRTESKVDSVNLLRQMKESNRPKPKLAQADSLATLSPSAIDNIKKIYEAPLAGGLFNQRSENSEQRNVLGNLGNQATKPTNVGQLVNHLAQNLTVVTSPLPVAKRRVRYKHGHNHLHALSKHGQPLKATSPLMTTSISPSHQLILPENLTNQRVDDKTRLGSRLGTMVRGASHSPGLHQDHGYSWE